MERCSSVFLTHDMMGVFCVYCLLHGRDIVNTTVGWAGFVVSRCDQRAANQTARLFLLSECVVDASMMVLDLTLFFFSLSNTFVGCRPFGHALHCFRLRRDSFCASLLLYFCFCFCFLANLRGQQKFTQRFCSFFGHGVHRSVASVLEKDIIN